MSKCKKSNNSFAKAASYTEILRTRTVLKQSGQFLFEMVQS
jgi:hypothetical protein